MFHNDRFWDYIENLMGRGVDFKDLVKSYGTPLYFIDAEMVKHNYKILKEHLDKVTSNNMICYAYKANTCLALLKVLKDLGAGAEVVSGGELYAAKLVGLSSDKIVFDGVSKNPNEIFEAVENGVFLINIENIDELNYINDFADKFGVKVSIGVRVNFDIPIKTHAHISTGARSHKFGLSVEDAFKAYKIALKMENINVSGIHVHLGSQIFDVDSYKFATSRIASLCEKLYDYLNLRLEVVDLGGGFGIPYSNDEDVFPLDEYCNVISEFICSSSKFFSLNPLLIVEPGRFIVGNAGILLTKVNYVKNVYGVKWVLVDAGMNDLIRPALYEAHHPIYNLSNNLNFEIYNVGGPICESSDVFAINMGIGKVSVGDILAIMNVGAYGFSMSSQYNSRPRAAIIMFNDGKTSLVRRRETYSDIFSNEIFL